MTERTLTKAEIEELARHGLTYPWMPLQILAALRRSRATPTDRSRVCAYCGKLTRVTTAGCDHCDVEDK